MISQPLFSVLVANYNNGNYFKDCFDSLSNQSYTHFEVIIVDDCSKDDSTEMIQNIIKEDSRFKLWINDENKGCGFTKRRCAELAKGEICGFLDPDDTITSDAIEIMVAEHLKNEKIGLIYSDFVFCDQNLKETKKHKTHQVENNQKEFYNSKSEISHFATYKKAIYERTEGINGYLKRAVDQDLYLKLYDTSSVLYIDKTLYHYRIHENGISTNTNQEKALFWRWVVMINIAENRNLNLEMLFLEQFGSRKKLDYYQGFIEKLKKSKWIKLGKKLGLIRNVDI